MKFLISQLFLVCPVFIMTLLNIIRNYMLKIKTKTKLIYKNDSLKVLYTHKMLLCFHIIHTLRVMNLIRYKFFIIILLNKNK